MAKLPWQAKLGIGFGATVLGLAAGIVGGVMTNQGLTDKWGDSGFKATSDMMKECDNKAEECRKAASYIKEQMAGAGNFKEI